MEANTAGAGGALKKKKEKALVFAPLLLNPVVLPGQNKYVATLMLYKSPENVAKRSQRLASSGGLLSVAEKDENTHTFCTCQ